MDHQQIDARSLAMHKLAVDLIRQEPQRLEHARATLNRWLRDAQPGLRDYLETWRQVIDEGIDAVAQVANDESERATALRQSSPISCTLSPRERNAFLKAWKERNEA